MHSCRITAALLFAATFCQASQPRVRPAEWAQPVVGSSIQNCYRVSDELFRSRHPGKGDIPDLHALGVRSLINLTHFRGAGTAFEQNGFRLIQRSMSAGAVSVADLVAVLREVRLAEKPVLVYCWLGSDRTGFIVAGYRIVLQNWPREDAIDEMRLGGFGFHEWNYPKMIATLQTLDVAAVRKAVFE